MRLGRCLLLPLLAAGCLGGPLTEGDEGAVGPEDPTLRPELVRCWIVPDAGEDPTWPQDHLFCQWNKPADATAFPIVHVVVQVVAGSRIVETQMLERWPGQPVEMTTLTPATDYPAKVAVQLLVGAGRPVGLETLGDLRASTTLVNAAAATAETPWRVTQAFDLWDVTIEVQSPLFEAFLHRIDVPLAPMTSPWFGSVAQAAGRFPLGRQGETVKVRIAVPPGALAPPPAPDATTPTVPLMAVRMPVMGSARLGRENTLVDFTLDGPGAYVATATGVTRVVAPQVPEEPTPE